MKQRNDTSMKKTYAACLPDLRRIAREHGYALGLHGSGERDLDLIAVPWIEDAIPPENLVEKLRAVIGGFIINVEDADRGDYTRRNPQPKPHGRLAWAIRFDDPEGRLYIDLSIMPLAPLSVSPSP